MKPGSRTHALNCRTLLKKGIDGEESEGLGVTDQTPEEKAGKRLG